MYGICIVQRAVAIFTSIQYMDMYYAYDAAFLQWLIKLLTGMFNRLWVLPISSKKRLKKF